MARLYLKLDNVVLREYPLADIAITIGRLADNTIQVDNLSVSGHHARIEKENDGYVLYDENSTNGTYVNGQKVARAVLVPGDTIHVGRHILAFRDDETPITVMDTPRPAAVAAVPAEPVVNAPRGGPIGVLTVVSGKTDQQEYLLNGEHNVIGKSETAAIRLTRWFAPKEAATIHHRDGRYFITESPTPLAVRVNSEVVHGEREIKPGDTILVDEITLAFNLRS